MSIEVKNLPSWGEGKMLAIVAGILAWIHGFLYATNVKDFGASGSPLTATGTIASGSNQLTVTGNGAAAFVASCKVGHGIFVEGTGDEGNGFDLVEKITAINGLVLTLANPSARPATNRFIQHDDSEAVNAAVRSVFYKPGETVTPSGGGGNIFLWAGFFGDEGLFNLNKKFFASTNSPIDVPYFNRFQPSRHLKFIGSFSAKEVWVTDIPRFGSILATRLKGTGAYPAILSARRYGDATGDSYTQEFNHLSIHVENVNFRLPDDSETGACYFGNAINASVKRCSVNTETHHNRFLTATVFDGAGFGFFFPQTNNNVECVIEDTLVVSCKVGYFITEHIQGRYPFAWFCDKAFVFTEGHRPNRLEDCGIEHCRIWFDVQGQNVVRASVNGEYFIGNSIVSTARYGLINDPTNSLFGEINISWTEGGVGLTTRQASVTGCAGVKFSQTTTPFAIDDGGAVNALVERLLPVADFSPVAVMKDEFRTPGNLENRQPDILQLDSELWHGFSNDAGTGRTSGNCAQTSSNGTTTWLYNGKNPNREFRLKFKLPSSGVRVTCRAVDQNNYLAVLIDRGAGTMQLSKTVAGVETLLGTVHNGYTAANDWVGIKCDNTNRLSFSINGTEIKFVAGVTDFSTATKVGFYSYNRSAFERAEII